MNAPAAPAQTFALIECEKGLGRMLPERCAGRWKIANGKVPITPAMRTGGVGGIINSPCRGCVHGEGRADGMPETQTLVQVTAARSPDQLEQRGREAKAQAERVRERALADRAKVAAVIAPPTPAVEKREPTPAKPSAAAKPAPTCVVCGKALSGRSKLACAGEHQGEYYRRKALQGYYIKLGDAEGAALAMRGQNPTEVRRVRPEIPCHDNAAPTPPAVEARPESERSSDSRASNAAEEMEAPQSTAAPKRPVSMAEIDAAHDRETTRLDRAQRRVNARGAILKLVAEFDPEERADLLAEVFCEACDEAEGSNAP